MILTWARVGCLRLSQPQPLLVAPLRQMHLVERQRLLVQLRRLADACEFPRRDVRVVLVVAQRLAFRRLAFLAEVAAARFARGAARRARAVPRTPGSRRRGRRTRGSDSGCPACPEPTRRARTRSRSFGILSRRAPQARFRARHADVVPQDLAELAVDLADRPRAAHREEPVDLLLRRCRRPL